MVQRGMAQQKRLIALVTELKKTLLHQLFTQGLRREPQKQTEIGPVPQSWKVRRLGDYARVLNGYAFKKHEHHRFKYRRLTLHKFTPVPGVHKSLHWIANKLGSR
jgi:hypothetical protein